MFNIVKKEGFNFIFNASACESCAGNCCIGESGYVWTTPQEIKDISAFLDMQEIDFRQQHLRKIGYKFSLLENRTQNGYICEFFDVNLKRCAIYKVRPSQCRTFPFWEYFKEHIEEGEKECPGIIRL